MKNEDERQNIELKHEPNIFFQRAVVPVSQLQIYPGTLDKDLDHLNPLVVESPEDCRIFTLSLLIPVHSPRLHQKPHILVISHLHSNTAEGLSSDILPSLCQNFVHQVYKW